MSWQRRTLGDIHFGIKFFASIFHIFFLPMSPWGGRNICWHNVTKRKLGRKWEGCRRQRNKVGLLLYSFYFVFFCPLVLRFFLPSSQSSVHASYIKVETSKECRVCPCSLSCLCLEQRRLYPLCGTADIVQVQALHSFAIFRAQTLCLFKARISPRGIVKSASFTIKARSSWHLGRIFTLFSLLRIISFVTLKCV